MSGKKIRKFDQGHRKRFGDIGEWTIENFLSAHGHLLRQRNHYYDMVFENHFKIEVKSAQLGVLRTGYKVRRVNHGWTLDRESHAELAKENRGYYALVLMIDDEVVHFRFIHAKKALKNLTNCLDYTRKPRIRLGALYTALTPKEFLEEVEKIKETEHGSANAPSKV